MISSAREGSTQTAAFSPSGSYQNTILVITVNDPLASEKTTPFIRYFNDKQISTQSFTIQISVVILSEKGEDNSSKTLKHCFYVLSCCIFRYWLRGEPLLQWLTP